MIEKGKTKSRIPSFANRQEEAEFWDTHDFGDYWDETEPADVEFSKNLSENLTVRLSPRILKQLRQQADPMPTPVFAITAHTCCPHLKICGYLQR